MAKPVILCVDDDPDVLGAVERDLRQKYGAEYRVMRADSGRAALGALDQLKVRGDPVALIVADQRMPEMNGVEFLERAMPIVPDAKRVLLTAYADTDAAINAINRVRIHYYLMKPWDPPEQNLYPFLTDLLAEWHSSYRPRFEGIRVIGTRWGPTSHAMREFLGRNLLPYKWLDVDTSDEARDLLARIVPPGAHPELPVVIFPDGTSLSDPPPLAVADKVGLRTHAEHPFYDLAVVGGGPAGLAAAVYGASEGLKTVLVEREAPGGQAGTSSNIENYLGFPTGLTGRDLARRAVAQATKFGAELITPQDVVDLKIDGQYRVITLSDGTQISARVLLVATGVSYRKLDVPGAEELTGAGVYYGSTTSDATSCVNEDVYIIGAGNSAGQAAVYFAQHARSVHILVRGDSLGASMSQYLVDEIHDIENIVVELRSSVVRVSGDGRLERITVRCADGQDQERAVSSLYVFIGAAPRTEWLGAQVLRDQHGFILTGADVLRDPRGKKAWGLKRDPFLLESCIPGVFAAGDVRHQSIKRVASAVGEGSIAVQFTHQYLAET